MADRVGIIGLNAALKAQCRVTTTANISLSGLQTIDSVSLAADDRVLVKNQTVGTENGIYVASTGLWQRATDCNGNRDLAQGTRVYVMAGTLGRGEYELTTTADPIIIDETALTWVIAISDISIPAFAAAAETAAGLAEGYRDEAAGILTDVGTAGTDALAAISSSQTGAVNAVEAAKVGALAEIDAIDGLTSLDKADQPTAETGTNDTKWVSSLGVSQHLTARTGVAGGVAPNDYTPLGTGVPVSPALLKLQKFPDALHDFGLEHNGDPDANAVAMMAMADYGRAVSLDKGGFPVFVEAGYYPFNAFKAKGFGNGIYNWHMLGYGATFQNVYPGPNAAWQKFMWATGTGVSLQGDKGHGFRIETMAEGDTAFTFIDVPDAGLFNEGDPVLFTDLDEMYYGFPPNPDHHDWRVLDTISGSGGTVTIPVRWPYRSDYPDSDYQHPVGQARIWYLNDLWGSHGELQGGSAYTGYPRVWNFGRHVFEGIRILPGLYDPDPQYWAQSGEHITYRNCVIPGISPTSCGTLVIDGCTITHGSEPDKIVDRLILRNSRVLGNMSFQSSSIDFCGAEDCFFTSLKTGNVKQFYGNRISALFFAEGGAGTTRGMARSLTVENSELRGFLGVTSGLGITTVDFPGDLTYSDGVFSIPLAAFSLDDHVVTLGQQLYFMNDGLIPFDANMGRVLRIWEDATNVYFQTNHRFASAPSGATKLGFSRRNNSTYVNCTGSAGARRVSLANQKGKKPWEWARTQFSGLYAQVTDLPLSWGILKELTVTVDRALAAESLIIGCVTTDKTDFSDYNRSFYFYIDLSVEGKRVLNQDSFTLLGNDIVGLGGNTVTLNLTTNVVNRVAHGFVGGERGFFTSNGNLPTGLSQRASVYILAAGITADTFQVSLTDGGAAIDFTGSQSGSHFFYLQLTDLPTDRGMRSTMTATFSYTPASYTSSVERPGVVIDQEFDMGTLRTLVSDSDGSFVTVGPLA